MKNVLKSVILAVVIAIAPGCSTLDELGISDLDFKITKINPLSGITVEISGKECQFGFTTDPDEIYDQVKSCILDFDSQGRHLLIRSSASPAPMSMSMAVEAPASEAVEELKIDKEAEKEADIQATIISNALLKRIESVDIVEHKQE